MLSFFITSLVFSGGAKLESWPQIALTPEGIENRPFVIASIKRLASEVVSWLVHLSEMYVASW